MATLLAIAMLLFAGAAAPLADSSVANAIQAGNRTAALELIGKGADVNAAEADGTTALHWAAHRDDVELVDRLLRAGARVNRTNDYGASPMSEAATVGNVVVMQKLLDAGADVESPNADGQTALMIVARTNNVAAARLLIGKGANVNRAEQWRQQTPLIWAAAQSQSDMVKELLARGADPNARSIVNAWERQVTGEPRAIHRPAGGLTPLLYAARQGCLECAKSLVASGAKVDMTDPEGVTPLIMAVSNGRFDTAAFLLSAGANPDKWDWWGRTPLYEAVDQNTLPHGGRPDLPSLDKTTSLQIIEMLLKAGVNPNPQLKLLPPYRAVGPDRGVDGILTQGATPLLRAAKGLDAPAIKLLLDHGARVDIPNSRGALPIQAAAGQGSRNGDTRGWFTTADAQERSIASLDLLLKAGAKIDEGAANGQSPLRGAVTWGWNDVIQFLADRGANLNAPDARGLTVLDSLTGGGGGRGAPTPPTAAQKETAALLQKLGAKPGIPTGIPAAPGGRGGR
jgi:ankyrin repeat protein